MTNLPRLSAGVLAGLLVAAPAWAQVPIDTIEETFTVAGVPEISVRNVDGQIEITAYEGWEVRVTAVKEVSSRADTDAARQAAEDVRIEMRQEGSRITLSVDRPRRSFGNWFQRRPRVEVHFRIETPARSHVEATSVDGDVTVTAIDGELRLRTVDGDVETRATRGSLAAQSVDGDIRLEDAGGELDLRTVDGDIDVDGVLELVHASTVDGDLVLSVRPGSRMTGDWELRSTDGEIILGLPEDFAADLDLRVRDDGGIDTASLSGLSRSETSRGRFRGQLNGGGPRLEAVSHDGDIEIGN